MPFHKVFSNILYVFMRFFPRCILSGSASGSVRSFSFTNTTPLVCKRAVLRNNQNNNIWLSRRRKNCSYVNEQCFPSEIPKFTIFPSINCKKNNYYQPFCWLPHLFIPFSLFSTCLTVYKKLLRSINKTMCSVFA